MRALVATSNAHKLREIRAVLSGLAIDLVDLDHLPPAPPPEETGTTFAENARLKARYYAARADAHWGPAIVLTVAEDSGLIVDALGGEPGVRSARFLRPDASYPERFAEIARRLAQVPQAPRTARFVCALAAARGSRVVFETEGIIEGEIAHAPRGTRGFGYDPIFWFAPYAATLAEVDEAAKLAVAHRGQAFRAFARWVAKRETKNGER